MKVENIDRYFSYEILRRGYDYYKKGKIEEIIKLKDGYLAKVKGTETYKVMIAIKDQEYKMSCTCPYAEEDNCKHMAAVLYSLKNGNIPTKQVNKINYEELTDFEKFKREYTKEYNRHFHARTYLYENELEEYRDIVTRFIQEGIKFINEDNELVYEIFEYFLIEVNDLNVADEYGQKEQMIEDLFSNFREIFLEERIFVRFLSFVGVAYSNKIDDFYFCYKEELLELLHKYIKFQWQAECVIILLNKLIRDKNIYFYDRENLVLKKLLIIDEFMDKDKALEEAEKHLEINGVCDYLIENYKNETDKLIELLEKMIAKNKSYSCKKYYEELLNIYEKTDKNKYLELLKKYFIEYGTIETYNKIKECYKIKDWYIIKKDYLDLIKENKQLYRDICVNEEYYDELLKSLENEWIETIQLYHDVLRKNKPKEYLDIYKNRLMTDIKHADSRKRYQYIMGSLKNMLLIPNSKIEVKNIIEFIRKNYKNKKALQEEVDFFEETFMN